MRSQIDRRAFIRQSAAIWGAGLHAPAGPVASVVGLVRSLGVVSPQIRDGRRYVQEYQRHLQSSRR